MKRYAFFTCMTVFAFYCYFYTCLHIILNILFLDTNYYEVHLIFMYNNKAYVYLFEVLQEWRLLNIIQEKKLLIFRVRYICYDSLTINDLHLQ